MTTFFIMEHSWTMPIAMAIHNIPEGIAIAVPTYIATRSVRTAFWRCFIAGLTDGIGATIGLVFQLSYRMELDPFRRAFLFGTTAGSMIMVSFMELMPEAYSRMGTDEPPLYLVVSILLGMLVMQGTIMLVKGAEDLV